MKEKYGKQVKTRIFLSLRKESLIRHRCLKSDPCTGTYVHTARYNYILSFQVSTPLLILGMTSLPTLFYCHFPDLLLSQGREASATFLFADGWGGGGRG
jgi:hypothetical protein